jgi:hypothetical protein
MMQTVTTLAVLAASMLAAGGPAIADHIDSNPPPPAEAQALGRLVGEWRGSATFTMGAQRDPARMSVSCRPTAAAFGVSCEARFDFAGGRVWQETDLFGWDAGARAYHWFAVTSTGNSHDHVAQQLEGDTWVFAATCRSRGKPMHEVIRLRALPDGKRIEFRSTGTVEGVAAFELTGNLSRQ